MPLSDLKDSNYKSKLLDLLGENLPDMLWAKDIEGNYLFANKAICQNLLMAKDTTEPIGKGDVFFAVREREKYAHIPDWHTFGELCFNSDEIVIKEDKPMHFEEYGNIKGKLVYLEVFKAPFYDENGKTMGTVGAGRDITHHKKVQLQLEDALTSSDEIQEMASIGTWEMDLASGVLNWSKQMYQIYGEDQQTFKPTLEKAQAFLTIENKQKILQAIQTGIETKQTQEFEYYITRTDGKVVHLLIRGKVLFDKEGSPFKVIGASLDITKRRHFENIIAMQKNEFEYKATHDALTGLPNRTLFLDRLAKSIETAKRENLHLAVLFLDLDHFKPINDSLGHKAGDDVLIELAHRMKEHSRKSDTIARIGGDEFCIILDKITDVETITKRLEDEFKIIEKPIKTLGQELHVGMSIGISVYPHDGNTPEELVKNADTAMYKAKNKQRGTFCFYDKSMTARALKQLTLEAELRNAVKLEQFEVFYQPQIDASCDDLVGMEALVRWQHPQKGLIYPDAFIKLAESMGLIVALDRIVIKTAMAQCSDWYQAGLNPSVISINLTMQQLLSDDFIPFLQQTLQTTCCETKHIEFEITETQIMNDPQKAIGVLNDIKNLGIKIAIDDFGTGYSSLAYLKRLPIDKLKIDKSFIDDLPHDSEDVAITKAVISLATSLGLSVIAEGVEEEEQKEFLLQNNCKNIQGYCYSKPINAIKMSTYLKQSL